MSITEQELRELTALAIENRQGTMATAQIIIPGLAGYMIGAALLANPAIPLVCPIMAGYYLFKRQIPLREINDMECREKWESGESKKLFSKYLTAGQLSSFRNSKKTLPPTKPGAIEPVEPVPLTPLVQDPEPTTNQGLHQVRPTLEPVLNQPEPKHEPIPNQQWEPIILDDTNADDYDWITPILHYPNWLIFGGQGSGKSTFTKWLLQQRKDHGDRVIVIDPHAAKGDWEGVEVFGAGKKFGQVELTLKWVIKEVDRRYEIRAKEGDDALKNEPFVTVACEEMTNWKDEIDPELLSKFDGTLVADIRKAKFRAVKLSHAKTQTATGGKAGLSETKQNYVRLNLKSRPDPISPDGVSPAFEAILTRPQGLPESVKVNPAWKPIATMDTHEPTTMPTDEDILQICREQNPSQRELHTMLGIERGNSAQSRHLKQLWRKAQSEGNKSLGNVIEFPTTALF